MTFSGTCDVESENIIKEKISGWIEIELGGGGPDGRGTLSSSKIFFKNSWQNILLKKFTYTKLIIIAVLFSENP